MELIQIDYGAVGFMVIIKLWQLIYSGKGYFYEWSESNQKLFSRRVNVDYDEVNAIINSAITHGIFDKNMFEKGVLTSSGIQKRFANMTLRRKTIEVYTDLLLIPIEKLGTHNDKLDTIIVEQIYTTEQLGVNVYNNPDKIRNNSDKCYNNRESKQKEKVNKERETEKETEKETYGSEMNVLLSSDEYKKIQEKYGADQCARAIEKLGAHKIASGKKYKSDYGALNSWVWEAIKAAPIKSNQDASGISFAICKNKECGKPIYGSLSFCTACGTDLFPKNCDEEF